MFGIKSFKDLDAMTVMLIAIVVILIIYFVRRSSNYSCNLIEGLTNNDDKPKDVKQFIKSIQKWEASSVKFVDTEVTDLNKLANALTSGLDFSSNCSNYENILIDLEDIAYSLSLIQCIDMMKQLNELGDDPSSDAASKLFFSYFTSMQNIYALQQSKSVLSDIHSWMGTKGCSAASSAMSGLFSKKSSKSSSSSSSNKSKSSNPFSDF